jgi:hypothetical protein
VPWRLSEHGYEKKNIPAITVCPSSPKVRRHHGFPVDCRPVLGGPSMHGRIAIFLLLMSIIYITL